MRIGIVGFGNFGKFLAKKLAGTFDVSVCDRKSENNSAACELGLKCVTIAEIAALDVVILAVPLQSMNDVLQELAKYLRPDTLVMDVCSVKAEPLWLMKKYFPETQIMATHPHFGPESAKDGWRGHRMTICPTKGAQGESAQTLRRFFLDQGLEILDKEAEDHDNEAMPQAIVHFISRALRVGLRLNDSPTSTTSVRHFLRAMELVERDSWDLFATVQSTQMAKFARRELLEALHKVEFLLNDEEERIRK